jgi:environmental stress-induced protein Ves
MRVIRYAEAPIQPWKNGRGITRELAVWPAPLSATVAGAYDVRLSVAEVTRDGPFSTFPRYRRWSFLAGPAPIVLDHALSSSLTVPGDHLELPGDRVLSAHLPAGPTHLVNVLARTELAVVVGHGPCAHPVDARCALIDTPGLPRWSAAVFDTPTRTDTTGCVWLVLDRA